MNHPTMSFYCPAHLYCFTAETTETLVTDVDLYDDKDRWYAAMIRNPTQYATLLEEALQQYANGILPLVDDKEYCDIISPPRSAQCALTAEGVSLWLEIKYPISHEPSPHEMLQIKKQIAASVETEIDTSQWGMIDRPEGALVVTFEPVEDWSFSTNGYQPKFTDLLEENHILTRSEWEAVTNQIGERFSQAEVEQNRARIYSDMPDCVRLLSALEKELGGNNGRFAEWLRISYELNSDFDVRPLDMTTLICDALKESKHLHGTKIARDLYDARTVVLPNEIRSASRYLSLGGTMESLDGLAHAGFLMEDLHAYEHGDIVRVAEFMSVGGAAEDAFAVLLSGEPEAHAEMSQQMR